MALLGTLFFVAPDLVAITFGACLSVGFWRFNYIHRAASLGLPRHWVRFRARYYSCCAVVARLPLSWPSEALACNMI